MFTPARILFLFIMALVSITARAQDLSTTLMNSTFEILGPSSAHSSANHPETTLGTVFVLAKPQRGNPNWGRYVLITAAHVLNGISGDVAILMLRTKGIGGTYSQFPYRIRIRDKGKNIYVKNPKADVAAMYLKLPRNVVPVLLSAAVLVDDAALKRLGIHPGDRLLCLGFPLGAKLNGFPIIRSGLLASYPITPSEQAGKYYYDFHVFPGNSGGPVYFSFSNRAINGSIQIGLDQGIIGLVSQELKSSLPEYKGIPLDVSVVVPSSFIRDTIAMLPSAP